MSDHQILIHPSVQPGAKTKILTLTDTSGYTPYTTSWEIPIDKMPVIDSGYSDGFYLVNMPSALGHHMPYRTEAEDRDELNKYARLEANLESVLDSLLILTNRVALMDKETTMQIEGLHEEVHDLWKEIDDDNRGGKR